MSEDVLDLPREGDDDWWPAEDDETNCTICGGEGWTECDDPIQCMAEHRGDLCPCLGCGGSGLGSDQRVW
jgi:hypothetical protein